MGARKSDRRDTGGRIRTRIAGASSVAVALIVVVAIPSQALPEAAPGPLTVLLLRLRLGDGDRRDLGEGRTVVKTLDAGHPSHIVVFAMARVDVPPEQFVARVRDAERLWRGPGVPAIGTFGNPPRLADVAHTSLSQGDLASLRTCRPGACDVKLSGPQIAHLRAAIERSPADWQSAARHAFRTALVEAIGTYRREGLRGMAGVHDHDAPIDREAMFAQLLASARIAREYAPRLADYLERYPQAPLPAGAEQHLHWLQTVLLPKATIQVWHATIQRQNAADVSEVVVLSRQVLATHYINGSLALTILTRAAPAGYLVYVNWTAVDGLDGFLSGLRRYFVERRVRAAAREAFETFKRRLEATE